MKLQEAMKRLEALGTEKVRAHYAKRGAGDNQYGVKLGDIRKVAKEIGSDQQLAMSLWETGNIDAQFLAILLLKPGDLSTDELNRLVRLVDFDRVADWFNSYVAKKHPEKETLRQSWMSTEDPMAARAGWFLTAERVSKNADGIDVPALLDRIESEMASAVPEVQWTMNTALVEIGISFPKHRRRAIDIGEKLGLYRDYPVPKGCTSPFAPIWINAMVEAKAG